VAVLGSQLLDLAIGATLFFLFISLICSSVREALETVLRSRSRDLERGLRMMLDDPDGTGLVSQLFQHGLISSLVEDDYDPTLLKKSLLGALHVPIGKRSMLPSYIPAGQFATALLDIVGQGGGTGVTSPPLNLQTLRSQALLLESPRLQRVVITAIDHAEGDLQQVKANLVTWFDGVMDRVSGWYKRRTQVMLFAIGLLAAIFLNLDALTVMKRLQNDDAFRQATVASAQSVLSQGNTMKDRPSEMLRRHLETTGFPIGWRTAAVKLPLIGRPVVLPVVTQLCVQPAGACNYRSAPAATLLLILLGWAITAMAATFGAPFWFDVLGKFMVIRSTIKPKPPTPADETPTPAPAS
jgi:hypothetical protein